MNLIIYYSIMQLKWLPPSSFLKNDGMICLVPIAAFKLLGSKKDQAIKINKIRQHSRYTNYIAAKNKIGDLKSLLEFILHVILGKKNIITNWDIEYN